MKKFLAVAATSAALFLTACNGNGRFSGAGTLTNKASLTLDVQCNPNEPAATAFQGSMQFEDAAAGIKFRRVNFASLPFGGNPCSPTEATSADDLLSQRGVHGLFAGRLAHYAGLKENNTELGYVAVASTPGSGGCMPHRYFVAMFLVTRHYSAEGCIRGKYIELPLVPR